MARGSRAGRPCSTLPAARARGTTRCSSSKYSVNRPAKCTIFDGTVPYFGPCVPSVLMKQTMHCFLSSDII